MAIIRKRPEVKVIGINSDGSAKLNIEPFNKEQEEELRKKGFTGWSAIAYRYDSSGDTKEQDNSTKPERTIDPSAFMTFIITWALILSPCVIALLGVLIYLHILYIIW